MTNIGRYMGARVLGDGRFSNVWEAACPQTGSSVAIKVYKASHSSRRYYENEITIMKLIGNTHTVGIEDAFECEMGGIPCKCIAMTLATGCLFDIIDERAGEGGLYHECERTKRILIGILEALVHIHKLDIIHGDIKAENVLLLNDKPLLADFGSSTLGDKPFSYSVGTDGYMAPELIAKLDYTNKVDMWAFCCLAYSLVTADDLVDVFAETRTEYGEDAAQVSYDSDDDSCTETDYCQVLILCKLLGKPPAYLEEHLRPHLDHLGAPKNDPDYKKISVGELIALTYGDKFPEPVRGSFASFVLSGFCYEPEERKNAKEMLTHEWLHSI